MSQSPAGSGSDTTNDATEKTVQLYAQYRQGLSPLPGSCRCTQKLLELLKEHFGDCYRDPLAISRIPLLHFGFYIPAAEVCSIMQSKFPAEWQQIHDLAGEDHVRRMDDAMITCIAHRFAKILNDQLKALPAPKTNIEGPVIFLPHSTVSFDEYHIVYALYSTNEPPGLFSWKRFAVAVDLINQLIPQREPMWFFAYYYRPNAFGFQPFDAQKVIPELAQFVADVRAGHYDDRAPRSPLEGSIPVDGGTICGGCL
ncbi:hypothetical protein C8Q77DRAFT_1070914 [Trametes polyzona]|nr:hypothetical protein C8Q77DRAFT_1070914 [Trametes polyzona]